MTPAQIVDQIGKLRAQIAPLAFREDKLRKLLIKKARGRARFWDGKNYRGTVSISDSLCYDVKKLDKLLDELTKKRAKSWVHKETLRVTALKKAPRRKAAK